MTIEVSFKFLKIIVRSKERSGKIFPQARSVREKLLKVEKKVKKNGSCFGKKL